jgi:hypothetical protein
MISIFELFLAFGMVVSFLLLGSFFWKVVSSLRYLLLHLLYIRRIQHWGELI